MKYITFAIPCYNSQDYMERCINSLVKGGEDVEVLVIDDGSMDSTGEIADAYERKYPGIVKAIHQENGGHGAGVNKGLELARGQYYKVVDSDDWLEESAYKSFWQRSRKSAMPEARKRCRICSSVTMCITTWTKEPHGR